MLFLEMQVITTLVCDRLMTSFVVITTLFLFMFQYEQLVRHHWPNNVIFDHIF